MRQYDVAGQLDAVVGRDGFGRTAQDDEAAVEGSPPDPQVGRSAESAAAAEGPDPEVDADARRHRGGSEQVRPSA